MGLEDEVVFDITDVILRGIAPDKALIRDSRSENLFFCAAPYSYNNELEPHAFRDAVRRIGEEMKLDYIIIDTPGDTGSPFRLAAAASDQALVVSTYQPASIRAAERTGILLSEEGVASRKLIINCFDADSVEFGIQPGLLEVIDKTCIQLLGIIPYDARLAEQQSKGQDVFTLTKANAAIAFANIAKRVSGRSVPLFTDFKKIKRDSLLKRIR
jgi:septum site-determining protein MinD